MNNITIIANCLVKIAYLVVVIYAAVRFDSKAVLFWFLFVMLIDVDGMNTKKPTEEKSIESGEDSSDGTP